MARARSDAEERARVEAERARVLAERAREEAERELLRIRTELQRVQSETSFQRVYPSRLPITAVDLGRAPGPSSLQPFKTSVPAFPPRSEATGRRRTSVQQTNTVDSKTAPMRGVTTPMSRDQFTTSKSCVTSSVQLPSVNSFLTTPTQRESPIAS